MTWPRLTCPCDFRAISDPPPPACRSNPSRRDLPPAPRRGATDWLGIFGGDRTRNSCLTFPEATAGVASARTFDTAWIRRQRGSRRRFCTMSRAVGRLGSERCGGILHAPLRPQKVAAERDRGMHREAFALAPLERP